MLSSQGWGTEYRFRTFLWNIGSGGQQTFAEENKMNPSISMASYHHLLCDWKLQNGDSPTQKYSQVGVVMRDYTTLY